MTTRNGKIARLPFEIREQLNYKLLENVPVKEILVWLETDSTVNLFLRRLFDGRKITEQNVSEWRQGGYEEWLTYRSYLGNLRDLSEDAARIALTDINAERLLMVLTASYADLLKRGDTTPEIEFNRKLIVLEHLTKLALSLRRSEQRDALLKLDSERVEILRKKLPYDSSTSVSSRAASISRARPPQAHPLHPKAPEIRRPHPPKPVDEWPDENDWSSPDPISQPHASGPFSRGPAAAVSSASPAPSPVESCEFSELPASPSQQTPKNHYE